jgi:hypothetical protein
MNTYHFSVRGGGDIHMPAKNILKAANKTAKKLKHRNFYYYSVTLGHNARKAWMMANKTK